MTPTGGPPVPAPRSPSVTPPPLRGEDERSLQLRRMKRRATGLLLVMAGAFVAVTLAGSKGWLGYAQAGIQASLVGGLADWFAVTALFRHPLGLPIPHTAIIRERKDDFGRTLGGFVQENFLTPDVITERLRSSRMAVRATDWLAVEANSAAVAGYAADLIVGLADVVRDEDVNRWVGDALQGAVQAIPLAPLAGRALRTVIAESRHQQLLDAVLRSLERLLDQNQSLLRERFEAESPWWLPGAVEDRIFDRLLDGFRQVLREVIADPNHRLRLQFDEWVRDLADRLEQSPELRQRGEDLKQEILSHPELRAWTASLWDDAKSRLQSAAADPSSDFRQKLAGMVAAAGRGARDDPVVLTKLEQLAEAGVRYVAEHFHNEISGLVTATIARWDPAETSRKLELLLGPDLQFIRINGTVVGGLAGLAIHALATVIG
jgi:uncharacterized membrane-anchored protein YjiN (DUF445 family)